ncbi:hypothetical protein NX722_28565 [Endozoicomonas gorgoniicola]|uniref:Uncharacterized protein n=1 Tax=Endozoicomonas gorgoniicola TaxID=1234144 RepID=A0ABT3N4B2_9GAMM|nr:hypothetical protein [Endozoicomonas gorgoniicola]MCW7556458.1 hypothetical protein [Endozoicomonas gorgoniicola]MCW7556521.1 hypothetical protein [Endozoicomonas gorgoniicola]
MNASDIILKSRLDSARHNVKTLMDKVSNACEKVDQATIEFYHYQEKLEEARAAEKALADEYNKNWLEGM